MIDFYYGSGSPYAWRAWLALEHKALPYELHVLSFSAGDLKTDAFRAINPRGKVPAITDGDFALAESAAIVDYLEDANPHAGQPLFPATPQARGIARWRIREIDEYVAHALEDMVDQLLFTAEDQRDDQAVAAARDRFVAEIGRFEAMPNDAFLLGAPGAVDFTLYPILALALRMQERKLPTLGVRERLGPRLTAWMRRVEALPYFARTYPPHWKEAA
jgi:glutathione S-transferase